MARYKVDKKQFDERLLQEQLKQVELQSKYLKDEPLKRSEVDEYNKLVANGWVKNTLISLGVVFSTAIALVIFVLLGNMLMTNGRTGEINKYNLDSTEIFMEFVNSDYYPDNSGILNNEIYIDYKVPSNFLTESGGNATDKVIVLYTLIWDQEYDNAGTPVIIDDVLQGQWVVGRDKETKTIGYLSQHPNTDNSEYQLDSRPVDLNTLMTNWFKGQEDGWAKTMIEDFFYTAWPLTLVLWLVFVLAIAGYAVVLVVGIRYVIRTVIVVLRRGGYIASDFVKEVVETVRSEIPLVETDKVEEIDFASMKSQLAKKMEEERANFKPVEDEEPEVVVEETKPKQKAPVKQEPEVEVVEEISEPEVVETPSKKLEKEKTGTDKVKDIFDL